VAPTIHKLVIRKNSRLIKSSYQQINKIQLLVDGKNLATGRWMKSIYWQKNKIHMQSNWKPEDGKNPATRRSIKSSYW